MKAVIIEDNISLVWEYEIILEELGIEVQGKYKCWTKALPHLKRQVPDLMIVDLFLENNEKGIDLIQKLRYFYIPTIVCTAYPEKEYMEEALDAGVVAFFTKPVDKPSLKYQLNKIVKEKKREVVNKEGLIIKNNGSLIKIPFEQIVKVIIQGNYSFIHLVGNKKYVVKQSLNKLIEQLDDALFIRCHRSTIINLSFIKSLNLPSKKIVLHSEEVLELGQRYVTAVKGAFYSS